MLFQFAVSPDITMGDLARAVALHLTGYRDRRYWIGQAGAEENMWVQVGVPDDPFEMYRLMRDAVYSRVFSQVDDLSIVTDYPSRFADVYEADELAEAIAMEKADVADFNATVDEDGVYNLSYRIGNDSNPCTVAEALSDITKCGISYWLDVGEDGGSMVLFVYANNKQERITVESAFDSYEIMIESDYAGKFDKLEKSMELHEEALKRLSE